MKEIVSLGFISIILILIEYTLYTNHQRYEKSIMFIVSWNSIDIFYVTYTFTSFVIKYFIVHNVYTSFQSPRTHMKYIVHIQTLTFYYLTSKLLYQYLVTIGNIFEVYIQ